ncbi:hypothetical protein Tco_0263034, partial [Tanacetum coccineum]
GDHRKVQLNELNELRDHAYENSLIYKAMATTVGVLLFNSRLKIFSGKLKSCWNGPFTITRVFPILDVSIASDYEDSHARSFVLCSLELQSLA